MTPVRAARAAGIGIGSHPGRHARGNDAAGCALSCRSARRARGAAAGAGLQVGEAYARRSPAFDFEHRPRIRCPLYSPVRTRAVKIPGDFRACVVGFVLLTVWRASPLLAVVVTALGGIVLAR